MEYHEWCPHQYAYPCRFSTTPKVMIYS
jgi:hypothetical protein